MRRLLAIALSLACGSVAALDIAPPAALSCGETQGMTMKSAVVSLMQGNVQRTYRTVPATASGPVTLGFAKRKTDIVFDGVRLDCNFDSPTGPRRKVETYAMPGVAVATGDTPRTVTVEVQASPRTVTWSPAATPVPPPPPPVIAPLPIPGNPTLVADPGGVEATWPASPGATGYVVTWGSNAAGDANTLIVGAPPLVVKMAGAGWLCVAASNSAGTSSNQCNSYTPPAAAGTATLTWDASPGADGYKLYAGAASRQYGSGQSVGNVLTFTETGLSSGRRYYFSVTAIKGGLESVLSNEIFRDF